MVFVPLLRSALLSKRHSALPIATVMAMSSQALMKPEAGTNPKKAANIYAFNAYDIDGNLVDLSVYQGHVCLIINVASK